MNLFAKAIVEGNAIMGTVGSLRGKVATCFLLMLGRHLHKTIRHCERRRFLTSNIENTQSPLMIVRIHCSGVNESPGCLILQYSFCDRVPQK
jgi:hypothetical protein